MGSDRYDAHDRYPRLRYYRFCVTDAQAYKSLIIFFFQRGVIIVCDVALAFCLARGQPLPDIRHAQWTKEFAPVAFLVEVNHARHCVRIVADIGHFHVNVHARAHKMPHHVADLLSCFALQRFAVDCQNHAVERDACKHSFLESVVGEPLFRVRLFGRKSRGEDNPSRHLTFKVSRRARVNGSHHVFTLRRQAKVSTHIHFFARH